MTIPFDPVRRDESRYLDEQDELWMLTEYMETHDGKHPCEDGTCEEHCKRCNFKNVRSVWRKS